MIGHRRAPWVGRGSLELKINSEKIMKNPTVHMLSFPSGFIHNNESWYLKSPFKLNQKKEFENKNKILNKFGKI